MSDTVESQESESEGQVTDETSNTEPNDEQQPENDEFKSEESKNAVLADLKSERERRQAAQAELDQFKQQAQAEAEKANEAIQRAEQTDAELLRYKAAAAHKITDQDDIELLLTGTDEETLTRQAERLAARDSAPNNPKPDLTQGASGKQTPPSNAEQFAQQLGDF